MAKKSLSQTIEEDLYGIRQDEFREKLAEKRAEKQAKDQAASARVLVDEIFEVMREQKIDPNTPRGFQYFTRLIAKRLASAAQGGGYTRTLSGEEDELDFSKKRSW